MPSKVRARWRRFRARVRVPGGRLGSPLAALGLFACFSVPAASAALPDGRGWELVSPVEKNGGQVAVAGGIAGGGVLQAAADGDSVTYGSTASFDPGALGAPEGSQYLARRRTGGWWSESLNVPIFSGSYGTDPEGVPYQLFSPDLSRGLLLSGRHCRSGGTACPVANPPLPGTDAPVGYQDYYLRQEGAGFASLLAAGDLAYTDLSPADFDLALAGAASELDHVVLSSCAALTPDATEVTLGEGCDSTKPNLYEWSAAGGLTLINPDPGAELAAQAGAISADGSRVYWRDLETGDLYLREGDQSRQVDGAPEVGGAGVFQTAAADGSVAYFTKDQAGSGGHLYRYDAHSEATTDLTPSGAVLGVLGASTDGTYVYYYAASGLYLWHGGQPALIAAPPVGDSSPVAAPGDYPPATGTARVTPDGTHLAFLSKARLTGYDNTDQKTGLPDSEVFLYDANTHRLRCVSCRTNGTRPIGPSTIPGAVANGQQASATRSYKTRVLSTDGTRVFFDSRDAVFGPDTNNEPDVYEWEAQGPGCAKAAGCVALLSSGRAEGGASFVDASSDGDDVFFVTDGSLVDGDPGSLDLYDARVGGGFPSPLVPIACFGDNCQSLPSEPVDPALSTLVSGPGNPKVHYRKYRRHRPTRGKKHGRGKHGHRRHGKGGATHGRPGGRNAGGVGER